MLRSIFVLVLVAIGAYYAVQAPFYALLFYIGNAYFRPEEWVWWNFVSSLKLSLISGAFVVLVTLFSGQRFVWNGRIALLWIFLLQTFLSTLGSEQFTHSWGYWTDLFKTIVITYMIIVLVNDFSKFRLIVLVMVLALGVEQARQGWVYLLTTPGWHNANPVPFLGDNNGVAVGMLILVPIVGLLGQTTDKKGAKGLYGILLIGCLYRALSTHSRGGFIAAIAMGTAWCLRSRHKTRALLGALLVITIAFSTLPDAFWNRMDTIETYEERQDESALGRLHFWKVAVHMANANPFRGVGYNGYNLSYNKYDFSGGAYGLDRSAHSSFFAVLAELGYVGTFLFVIVIFSAFRSCSRIRKLALKETAFSDLGKSAIALQTGLVGFLVGGSFVIFQYSEMLWHVIGLTIVVERLAKQRQAEIVSGERLATSVSSVPAKVSTAA
jgi:probable O-glycosylation ligase (exosortase A-associated)